MFFEKTKLIEQIYSKFFIIDFQSINSIFWYSFLLKGESLLYIDIYNTKVPKFLLINALWTQKNIQIHFFDIPLSKLFFFIFGIIFKIILLLAKQYFFPNILLTIIFSFLHHPIYIFPDTFWKKYFELIEMLKSWYWA